MLLPPRSAPRVALRLALFVFDAAAFVPGARLFEVLLESELLACSRGIEALRVLNAVPHCLYRVVCLGLDLLSDLEGVSCFQRVLAVQRVGVDEVLAFELDSVVDLLSISTIQLVY